MTRRRAVLALAASVPLLVGCGAAPALPAGLAPEDVQERIDEANESWWRSLFPDEPVPDVQPVAVVEGDSAKEEVLACVSRDPVGGVSVTADGAVRFDDPSRQVQDAFFRKLFACTLQHPLDTSRPEALGYLSPEQTALVDAYLEDRLVPCLELLGYTVHVRLRGYNPVLPATAPLYDMYPIPSSDSQWGRIDARCPPAPWVGQFRPHFQDRD